MQEQREMNQKLDRVLEQNIELNYDVKDAIQDVTDCSSDGRAGDCSLLISLGRWFESGWSDFFMI